MTRRKPGRPSQGLSETRMEIRLPKAVAKAVRSAAKEDGVSLSEWWRWAAIASFIRSQRLREASERKT